MALGKTGLYPVWSRRAGAAGIVGAITAIPTAGRAAATHVGRLPRGRQLPGARCGAATSS